MGRGTSHWNAIALWEELFKMECRQRKAGTVTFTFLQASASASYKSCSPRTRPALVFFTFRECPRIPYSPHFSPWPWRFFLTPKLKLASFIREPAPYLQLPAGAWHLDALVRLQTHCALKQSLRFLPSNSPYLYTFFT